MGEAAAEKKMSGLAVASLILGLMGLLTLGLTSLVGLILGIVAMVKISNSKGKLDGMGLAIAGTCVSLVIPLVAVIGAGLMLPALATARSRARRVKCMSNMKQIGVALHVFSADNDDAFPASLDELDGRYVADGAVHICPETDAPGYEYVPGLTVADPVDMVLLYDKAGNHSYGLNVLMLDGHVEWMLQEAFKEALRRTMQHIQSKAGDE